MGVVNKPNDFTANTTISSSEVNDNFDTIYDEFNGNIDASNLAAGAVTTAKIADTNVTTGKLADNAVTSAKIAAGTITPSDMDLSTPGASMWYEELARLTLGASGDTMTTASFTAKKYLRIIVIGIATGGTIRPNIRFNGDTGSNYAFRYSANGGADTTANTQSAIQTVTTASQDCFMVLDVINISASEKQVTGTLVGNGAAGVGTPPGRTSCVGKWVNTASQITAVTVFNDGTGDFSNAGSEVVVLGHN